MRKYLPLIAFSLFICLFIYLFFRTDKTVINQVFISLFSKEVYLQLKSIIHNTLPLHTSYIYSLPEGLWVFCITITSRFFYIRVWGKKVNLSLAPIAVAIGMELCQLLHILNGRFDFMDIGFSILFWFVAYKFTDTAEQEENILTKASLSGVSCVGCYGIVYLAHVIQ